MAGVIEAPGRIAACACACAAEYSTVGPVRGQKQVEFRNELAPEASAWWWCRISVRIARTAFGMLVGVKRLLGNSSPMDQSLVGVPLGTVVVGVWQNNRLCGRARRLRAEELPQLVLSREGVLPEHRLAVVRLSWSPGNREGATRKLIPASVV